MQSVTQMQLLCAVFFALFAPFYCTDSCNTVSAQSLPPKIKESKRLEAMYGFKKACYKKLFAIVRHSMVCVFSPFKTF